MIEALIYSLGVTVIVVVCMTIIVWCVYTLSFNLVYKMVKKLGSVYLHVQLIYFMDELKKKGYAQCVEEIGKNTEQDA